MPAATATTHAPSSFPSHLARIKAENLLAMAIGGDQLQMPTTLMQLRRFCTWLAHDVTGAYAAAASPRLHPSRSRRHDEH